MNKLIRYYRAVFGDAPRRWSLTLFIPLFFVVVAVSAFLVWLHPDLVIVPIVGIFTAIVLFALITFDVIDIKRFTKEKELEHSAAQTRVEQLEDELKKLKKK